MSNVEAVQTLVNLGLTVLQAKTYLALVKLGASTGNRTAKAANIAPPDIYRILAELREKGLVQKIVTKPSKYTAMTLQEGSEMLLQQREKQTTELKKGIDHMCKSLIVSDVRQYEDGSNEFILETVRKTGCHRGLKMFQTAQTTIDLMISNQEAMCSSDFVIEALSNRLNNGVKIREILGKTSKNNKTAKWFANLEKMPAFQVRSIDFPNPATLIIKDNEILIGISTKAKREQPHLWSNNPVLVRVIKEWYNMQWENLGKESKLIK